MWTQFGAVVLKMTILCAVLTDKAHTVPRALLSFHKERKTLFLGPSFVRVFNGTIRKGGFSTGRIEMRSLKVVCAGVENFPALISFCLSKLNIQWN